MASEARNRAVGEIMIGCHRGDMISAERMLDALIEAIAEAIAEADPIPQHETEGVVEVPEPWPLKGSTRVDVAAGLLEEKVREKLMALGWTPPPEAQEETDGDGGQDLRTEVYLSVSELLGRGLKGHEAMIAEEAMKATLRARVQQEPEGESVRCSCDWSHPVDGSVRSNWPAELDPACPVHAEAEAQQEPGADGWEQAREDGAQVLWREYGPIKNMGDMTIAFYRAMLATALPAIRARVQTRSIAYEDEDGQERCQGCGTPVRVVTADEGTSYYEPVPRRVSREELEIATDGLATDLGEMTTQDAVVSLLRYLRIPIEGEGDDHG